MNSLFERLENIIKGYDNFIVMGHKDPDLDSLGSCLGFCEIVESFNKKAYLFLNDKHLEKYNSNINQAFNRMEKDITCVNEKTYKKVLGNTLLVVLDVHSKERMEYGYLADIVDTIVIDHHIKNHNYLKSAKYMYIDSNLSSISELITYYANFLSLQLDNVIATILLAGIEIDTNSYNLKTTSNTYKAASYLMDMGADSILKQELLKETKEDYIKRANFIRNSFMATPSIAMCIVNKQSTSIELSEICEELLTFEDVQASFTIGRLDDETIGVSAKSLGEYDVRSIMEKLNGGGHTSNAAAQIKKSTIKEVKQKITNLINN